MAFTKMVGMATVFAEQICSDLPFMSVLAPLNQDENNWESL